MRNDVLHRKAFRRGPPRSRRTPIPYAMGVSLRSDHRRLHTVGIPQQVGIPSRAFPLSTGAQKKRAKPVPEDVIEGAVEKEITGGVDGQQEVRDLPHTPDEVVTLVVAKPEDGRHDGVGSDADDEDDDDGDEHECDAVSLSHLVPGGGSVATAGAPQGLDDETVEGAEDGQRHDGAKQVLGPRVGDDEVLVRPEGRQL